MTSEQLSQGMAINNKIEELQKSSNVVGKKLKITYLAINDSVLRTELTEFELQLADLYNTFINDKIMALETELSQL